MKPRRMAVFGLTAGLLGGGAAGLLMTGTTLASAQTAGVTGTVTDPAAGSTDSPAARARKAGWAKGALDKLVADGTINQDQADKVLAALQAARPAHGHKGLHRGAKLDAAAQALGMTPAELRTALAGGKNLAAVAQEKGVDVAKVVDALVAQLKTHLDQHVASGKNTQAQADQRLADARSRIEAFVNGTAPAGGPGFKFGRSGRQGRGPIGVAPAPSSASGHSGTTVS